MLDFLLHIDKHLADQMLIYAAFQEKETQRNYEHLRGVLAGHGSFGAAHGLRIIPVETFQQALHALATLPKAA